MTAYNNITAIPMSQITDTIKVNAYSGLILPPRFGANISPKTGLTTMVDSGDTTADGRGLILDIMGIESPGTGN